MMKLFDLNRKPLNLNGIVFEYVTENDKLLMKCVIGDNKINSWNLNYENIMAYNTETWQNIVYKIIDGCICFFCFYPDADETSERRIDFAFRPLPIDISKKYNFDTIMRKIKKILMVANNTEKVHMVYLADADRKLLNNVIRPHKVKSFNEFNYNLSLLNTLEGSHFKNVRRDFNRFERDYPDLSFVPYDKKTHKNGCISLLALWESDYKMRWHEKPLWQNSMLYYLEHLENTDTSHAYVLLDGNGVIIGYMNAVFMYDDNCCCIKRITNNSYPNSSNYLLIRTVRELYKLGYNHMNDGNAGGDTDKSLGSFKMKYVDETETYQHFLYSGTFK